MEKTAYVILALVAVGWIVVMIAGMIAAFPMGLIGLAVILALGLLFVKAFKDRASQAGEDRYSRDVRQ